MDKIIDTKIEHFTLRFAKESDVDIILDFIKALAAYEKMSEQVTTTKEILEESLFHRNVAEVIIGEYYNKPVGFMLFFYNFSTFIGKPGIYLEDLYINEDMRNKSFGKVMLSYLAKLTVERDCKRLEWSCLKWNEPSIKFYKKLGAIAMDEWTTYRLTGAKLKELANK